MAGQYAAGGTPRMRAAFFEAAATMTVREVAVPAPPPGEVRLAVRYCGICGSDLSVFPGGALAGPDVVLGHEVVGVVDHDPAGSWEPGTRVVVFPPRGCGDCLWCREGHPRYCENPLQDRWGGFAEYACYPSAHLIEVPDDVPDRAAALADPLGVALRAVDLAAPQPGDLAYVGGLGPIGLCVVAGLVSAGCTVIGGEPREERRRLGMELGCREVLDPTREDPYQAALSIDPHGPRLAFECSGHGDALQQVFDVCGPQGTVGILGIPKSPVLLLRMTLREQRAFSISGPTIDSLRAAVEHLRAHPDTADIVTGVVGLDGLGSAIGALIEGHASGKILVDPRA